MDNWNYDRAVVYIDAIPDPVSRRLTKLFFDQLLFLQSSREAYPECEFDLLFFVKAVCKVTCQPKLLQVNLEQGDRNPGWDAIARLMEEWKDGGGT